MSWDIRDVFVQIVKNTDVMVHNKLWDEPKIKKLFVWNTFTLHEHMPQHNSKRDTLPHCA